MVSVLVVFPSCLSDGGCPAVGSTSGCGGGGSSGGGTYLGLSSLRPGVSLVGVFVTASGGGGCGSGGRS